MKKTINVLCDWLLAVALGLIVASHALAQDRPATTAAAASTAAATAAPAPPATSAATVPSTAATPASSAAPVAAGNLEPVRNATDLLRLMPTGTHTFVIFNDVGEVPSKLARVQQKTGLALPLEGAALGQFLDRQIGVRGGLAQKGPAAIIYLDPQEFKGRNSLYLVPVQGLDAFLQYNPSEEVEPGLYRLTTTPEARFFSVRGGYLLFADSLRTAKTVRDGGFDISKLLTDEQRQALGRSDLYLHADMRQPKESRSESADRFRQATLSRIMGDPGLRAYSDFLLRYMMAVNSIFEQLTAVDLGLRLEADDLSFAVFVRFAEGGDIHSALANLNGPAGTLGQSLPLDRPVISSGSLSLKSEALTTAVLTAVDFLSQPASAQSLKTMRSETRQQLLATTGQLVSQFTGELAFMSALPDEKSGAAEANLTIIGVKDQAKVSEFLPAAFEMFNRAGAEINSKVQLTYERGQEKYRDVTVDFLRPKIAFVNNRFEELFLEQVQRIYGPDGFVYRLALVKNKLFVMVGSDQTLFRAALDQALDDKPAAASSQIQQVRSRLPKDRTLEYCVSLPALLSRTIIVSGPAEGATRGPVQFDEQDRRFIADQGVIGLAMSLDGGRVRLDGSLGYEQLAKALEFARRHLPPMKAEPTTPEPALPATGPSPEPAAPVPATTAIPAPVKPTGPSPEPAAPAPAATATPAASSAAAP